MRVSQTCTHSQAKSSDLCLDVIFISLVYLFRMPLLGSEHNFSNSYLTYSLLNRIIRSEIFALNGSGKILIGSSVIDCSGGHLLQYIVPNTFRRKTLYRIVRVQVM